MSCPRMLRRYAFPSALLLLLAMGSAALAQATSEKKLLDAGAAFNKANYNEMERLCQEVIRDRGKVPEAHVAWAHLELGKLFRDVGLLTKAMEHLDTSLAIYQRNEPETSLRSQGGVVHTQGLVLMDAGKFTEAAEKFAAAKALFTQAETKATRDTTVLAAVRERLITLAREELVKMRVSESILLRRLGQFDEAERTLLDVIREYRAAKNHRKEMESCLALGNVYAEARQDDKTEPQLERALALAAFLEDPVYEGVIHNSLGWFHQRRNAFPDARREFAAAEKLLREKIGEDTLRVAQVQSNLGWLQYLNGEYEAAGRLFKVSLETRERKFGQVAPDHPDLALSRYNRALGHAALDNFAEASRLMDLARKSTRRYLARELPRLGEANQLDFIKKQRDDWHAVLSLGAADANSAEAVASWVVNHKGLTLELAGNKLARALGPNGDPWIRIDSLRKRIPKDAVLIEIARFGNWELRPRKVQEPDKAPRYVAWIIPPSGSAPVRVVPLGDGNRIDQAVADVTREINATLERLGAEGEIKTEKQAIAVLRKLSELVFEPIRKHVANSKHLIISPDGALWQVPWAALPLAGMETPDTENHVAYAVEHHLITFVSSGRDLMRSAGIASTEPAVVLAGLDYGKAPGAQIEVPTDGKAVRGGPFIALPSSRDEATAVSQFLKSYTGAEPTLKGGSNITVAQFRKIKQPQVLYISTHGYSIDAKDNEVSKTPLARTGLAMSNANLGPNNCVTGEMIRNMDLVGTELVTLSACDTARGKILSDAQGNRSLQQAFHLAGARTVVGTQWKVRDAETTQLMKLFFQRIAGKEPKAVALWKAQRDYITTHREAVGVAHPFFWAAFHLSGDWQ